MAISRSLMNRQLQADGGIMQVSPREKFGLGSKLKKFARKIIPNEVADIAVKAAPFVAPFNPALSAAMSGIGTFDQTGSIGDSLKAGGLNYAGGQAARYIGGAGFQGNPFQGGLQGTLQNFSSFSSPIGSKTGLGKFFSNRGTPEIQGIDMQTGGADGVGVIGETPTKTTALASEVSYVPEGAGGIDMATAGADGVGIISDTVVDKTIVTKNNPGFLKNMFDGIANQDYDKIARTIGDGAKKFGKAMFTNKDGSIDKAAVLGAVAFASSYAEAKALAADAGVDLTEEEYDEATKAEKKEEYASYLTNFFAGRKDGGRIGYSDGTKPSADEAVTQQMVDQKQMAMIEDMLKKGMDIDTIKTLTDASDEMIQDRINFIKYGGAKVPIEKADGGRIGFKKGSPEEPSEIGIMSIDVEAGGDEDNIDDLMAGITFSSAEKSFLFRTLAGQGGASRSYTMPNLYRILSNPNRYPKDAAILKEIALMRMKKDGGRIAFAGGSNRVAELLVLRDEKIGKGEDVSDIEAELFQLTGKTFKSIGGVSDVPTGNLRKNQAGVIERDYRDEGGFVPVGIKERADDVPAMLSKNEFVMTADAVRGIGGGDVEKGSKRLYNTMKQAEKVGKA